MEIATRRREQEVWQACDDLWSQGGDLRSLTGDAIRERLLHLGKSRGSPNEIYKYRRTWIDSRNPTTQEGRGGSESDPIARAVKLVHEKLQSEASEQVLGLQRDFEEALSQKDEEVAEIKRSLERLMAEVLEFQTLLEEKNQTIKRLQAELLAEADIRKATERELQLTKASKEQEQRASEVLVNELKQHHQEAFKQLTERERLREHKFEEQQAALMLEKKQLGIEFSEQLTELKVALYNKDIAAQQALMTIKDFEHKTKELQAEFLSQTRMIDLHKTTIADLLTKAAVQENSLSGMHERLAEKDEQLKIITFALQKSAATVTKLRFYHKGHP